MTKLKLSGLVTAGAVAAIALGYAAPTLAQKRTKTYAGALTPSGIPNLEGSWGHSSLTPFERPVALGTRAVMLEKDVAELEGSVEAANEAGRTPTDQNATTESIYKAAADCHPQRGNCNYNNAWVDPGTRVNRINGEPRTSIVTFPANGRIPWKNGPPPRDTNSDESVADNPEDLRITTRCVIHGTLDFGAVIQDSLYNNNIQIVQAPNHVALVSEKAMIRIARLNAQHRQSNVAEWFGDEVAHYEGDTLVVETINVHPLQRDGAGPKLKVTERYTRVAPDRLLYRFQVEDPDTFTQPWGGEQELFSSEGLYEFACHEGNYGMINILAGARADDKLAAAGGATAPTARTLLTGRPQ